MGIDIRRNIYRPMQDMTFAAATHLVLPIHNDPVTPTLAFGDGNTGFYESVDNTLNIAINGNNRWQFGSNTFGGNQFIGSGQLYNLSSNIVPGLTFNGDTNTGVGRPDADQLSLIAGAIEGLRVTEANGVANMNIICHGNAVICHENEVVTCGSA